MIIPVYNAETTFVSCLESLKKQTVKPFQIILVNDSSTDRTVSIASEEDVEVISFSTQKGPAMARNAGAQNAQGDIILFLDADVIIPPYLIEKILQYFHNHSSIDAVQTIYSPFSPAENLVSKCQNFYYYHALTKLKEDCTATFATWCAAIRKKIFFDVGMFNTGIAEPTIEDEELGYEIADRGLKIVLAHNIYVTHLASYTTRQFGQRRFRMAKAQAKSGWRSIKNRLVMRYINFRETGTHHSRSVVFGILLVLISGFSLALSIAGIILGLSLSALLSAAAFIGIFHSLACNSVFFQSAVTHFGFRILPAFILLCLLDMTILGSGVITGTFQFLFGKHY